MRTPLVQPIWTTTHASEVALWTLAHTEGVLRMTQGKPKPEVALIGAGFIGFIVLNAMYKRGWKLHVVEIADHVLPRMLERP